MWLSRYSLSVFGVGWMDLPLPLLPGGSPYTRLAVYVALYVQHWALSPLCLFLRLKDQDGSTTGWGKKPDATACHPSKVTVLLLEKLYWKPKIKGGWTLASIHCMH